MLAEYLREYLNIADVPFEENREFHLFRVKCKGYICYIMGDDFLNRICAYCVFSFLVPEENFSHMREFLNQINARISYAAFVLDEDRQLVCIRSEALAGSDEFIIETTDYLITGLHKDAYDFRSVLMSVSKNEISIDDAIEAIIQQQKSYDIFQPPWGGFVPNFSDLTSYELNMEARMYFMRNHKNFTTICTDDNMIFYAEPILGTLDVNENRKSLLLTGTYEGQYLESNETSAIESVSTVNREVNLGCFYVAKDQIFFRVQHQVSEQDEAEHDVSLLIQILLTTMSTWYDQSFCRLLAERLI